MNTIFITDSVETALFVADCGVTTVMVDLEVMGKFARQGHLDTVISTHTKESISFIAESFKRNMCSCQLLVRTNPVHDSIAYEINECIDRGAMKLMLPMFHTPAEVNQYLSLVDKRVPVTLLLETPAAYARLDDILALPFEFDIHVGLNDLHLGFGLDFMFELVSCGLVENIASKCHANSVKFGFGGVARLSTDSLLSPSDILSAHIAYGSDSVILSRDWRKSLVDMSFRSELSSLYDYIAEPRAFDKQQFSRMVQAIAGCYC